jgi:hypothetical protein
LHDVYPFLGRLDEHRDSLRELHSDAIAGADLGQVNVPCLQGENNPQEHRPEHDFEHFIAPPVISSPAADSTGR